MVVTAAVVEELEWLERLGHIRTGVKRVHFHARRSPCAIFLLKNSTYIMC